VGATAHTRDMILESTNSAPLDVCSRPACRHSGLVYVEQMQRRFLNLILIVGLPVLVGQFAFDWIDSDLNSAVSHLSTRALLVLAVLLVWTAFREYRERKKQTVR
jgi:undecaprenyl pyrophosphate phosphatase UppP